MNYHVIRKVLAGERGVGAGMGVGVDVDVDVRFA
jgi:hypothetical protein